MSERYLRLIGDPHSGAHTFELSETGVSLYCDECGYVEDLSVIEIGLEVVFNPLQKEYVKVEQLDNEYEWRIYFGTNDSLDVDPTVVAGAVPEWLSALRSLVLEESRVDSGDGAGE